MKEPADYQAELAALATLLPSREASGDRYAPRLHVRSKLRNSVRVEAEMALSDDGEYVRREDFEDVSEGRERWKAEAMAARRLLYETGRAVFSQEGEMEMDAERDYATARAANGEE